MTTANEQKNPVLHSTTKGTALACAARLGDHEETQRTGGTDKGAARGEQRALLSIAARRELKNRSTTPWAPGARLATSARVGVWPWLH